MTARQAPLLAGSASAMAAVVLGLAGCAAASHPTANTRPRPASATAAAAHSSRQSAAGPATVVRRASTLLKCADPAAPGGAPPAAGGMRASGPAATAPAARAAALGGSASPIPVPTTARATLRQVGVVNLSQPGLVVLCGPVPVHCPPGFRAVYRRDLSGRRPRVLLPYMAACIARFRVGTLPPEPRLTPVPVRTLPLRTMPPVPPGS
jgi:hypothetical protein